MQRLNEGTMILAVENYTMEDVATCPICGEEFAVPTMKLTEEDSEPICVSCFHQIQMDTEEAFVGCEETAPDPMVVVESYAIEYDNLTDDSDDFRDCDLSMNAEW